MVELQKNCLCNPCTRARYFRGFRRAILGSNRSRSRCSCNQTSTMSRTNQNTRVFLVLLFVLAVCMHNSHVAAFGAGNIPR